MEIADGLWQLKIPMRYNPLGYTCSYLVVDDATLIDTGVGTGMARQALDRQLLAAGLEASDIRRVILTHLHRDHIGLVEYIRSKSGAKVLVHERAREVLTKRTIGGEDRYGRARREFRALGGRGLLKFLSRFEYLFRRRLDPLHFDETVSGGDLLKLGSFTLRVIWTPGHTSEHICLYEENRQLLLSGDHILPRITSHIGLRPYEDADPLEDYLSSLEKIRGLPVDLVLPAHEHAFRNLDNRIEELELHHEARCREIKEALGGGERTVFQVSERVPWDSGPWTEMSFWTKRMAANETLAHLVYLRNRGEVEEREVDGILYYRLGV